MLLVTIAKFDPKTLQLDVVNTFIHANLNKTILMRMFLEYANQKKVLRPNKTLYRLQKSLLL